MVQLSGRRVLVTGASGLVAFPLAVELAKNNEVYALARFTDPEQKRALEAAGARTIVFDMAEHDLSPLPRSVDVVINYGVLPFTNKEHYNVNAGAAGRLARRYRGMRMTPMVSIARPNPMRRVKLRWSSC